MSDEITATYSGDVPFDELRPEQQDAMVALIEAATIALAEGKIGKHATQAASCNHYQPPCYHDLP